MNSHPTPPRQQVLQTAEETAATAATPVSIPMVQQDEQQNPAYVSSGTKRKTREPGQTCRSRRKTKQVHLQHDMILELCIMVKNGTL
eukprot:4929565-Amphidinium_carterae.1